MNKYQKLEIELVLISANDIVTASPGSFDENRFDDMTGDDVFTQ